jgi:hypothetical protein
LERFAEQGLAELKDDDASLYELLEASQPPASRRRR